MNHHVYLEAHEVDVQFLEMAAYLATKQRSKTKKKKQQTKQETIKA